MDHIKILKRAWQILWSYRALWVFGLILALTTSSGSFWRGGGGHGTGSDGGDQRPFNITPSGSFDEGMRELRDWFGSGLPHLDISQPELQALIWIGIILLVGLIFLSLAVAIARYVSETAVIRMVNDFEESGIKAGIRQGFRFGWSRTSWRLFLINLLVNLPVFLLVLVLLLAGVGIYLLVSQGNQVMTVVGIVASVGFLFLTIFLVVIISAVLSLLRHFFWRACALDQIGVRQALSQGFALVRENWKNVGLMWLIMIGLGIAWSIVSVLSFILLIPVFLLTALAGVIVGAVPLLIVAGITSIFLSGPLPWIVGALAGLPWFALIAFSPMVFLQGLAAVFTSSVWTLTYRELRLGTVADLVVEKTEQ